MTHTMFRRITKHPNFTVSDYTYLSDKGYEDEEILKLWNRRGARPVAHKPIDDYVGYFTKGLAL